MCYFFLDIKVENVASLFTRRVHSNGWWRDRAWLVCRKWTEIPRNRWGRDTAHRSRLYFLSAPNNVGENRRKTRDWSSMAREKKSVENNIRINPVPIYIEMRVGVKEKEKRGENSISELFFSTSIPSKARWQGEEKESVSFRRVWKFHLKTEPARLIYRHVNRCSSVLFAYRNRETAYWNFTVHCNSTLNDVNKSNTYSDVKWIVYESLTHHLRY